MSKVQELVTLLLQIENQEMNSPQIYTISSWLDGARSAPATLESFLQEDEKTELDSLAKKIDSLIEKLGGSAFIRLSTRSPKDAALRTKKMRDIIKRIIQSESDSENLTEEEKDIRNMMAFTIACQQSLRMESGKEAVSLLYQR